MRYGTIRYMQSHYAGINGMKPILAFHAIYDTVRARTISNVVSFTVLQ
jgi:hypothetical protein